MISACRAGRCIGRVGALAVALGIGAAMTAGTAVAFADDAAEATDAAAPAPVSEQSAPRGARPAARPGRGAQAPAQDTAAITSSIGNPPGGVSRAPRRIALNLPVPEAGDSGRAPVTAAARASVPAPAASVPAWAANDPEPLRVLTPAAPAVRPTAAAPASDPVALQSIPVAVATVAAPVIAPAAPVAAPAPALSAPVSRMLTRALAAFGAGAPGVPAQSPALWALLAWTRRESARTLVGSAASRLGTADAPTAAVTAADLATVPIGWVTGQSVPLVVGGNRVTQTNNTRWANIYGTDLGIMWFNEDNQRIQLAFGDTFSGPNMTGTWINNALLLSDDRDLYDGLTLINTGPAFQFIPDARDAVFFIGSEVTNIPTAAVYANGTNYVNYMSVKSWDTPGRWTTNYSAVSQFVPDPDGGSWQLQRSTIRSAGWFRSSTPYRAGDQNFQQMAYVLQPEDKVVEGQPRYVYAFGTPSGRAGSAFLSRVPENALTDLAQYEYWDGSTWVKDRPAVAVRVLGDSDNSAGLFGFVRDLANNPNFFGGWFAGLFGAKTGGNVSELSVQYNDYLGKYVAMYGNGLNNIVLRTADDPTGPWSEPITVASSLQYPGLYAPFMHPLSGTGELRDANGDPDVSNLYWNMSLWGPYNVILMKTDLSALKTTLV